jgi:hypothetical protein
MAFTQRDKVLENTNNLKGKKEYKKVTLAPDQTKKQKDPSKEKESSLKAEGEIINAALGKYHGQEVAKCIVIRGQLRGQNDTPCGRTNQRREL